MALASVIALAGCQRASADADTRALVRRGEEVYRTQYCGTCHALSRLGTGGRFGPSHDGVGATAEERIRDLAYKGAARTAQEYLEESIIDPGAYRVPGFGGTRYVMPSYRHLPDEDIEALVQMLLRERSKD
ncbi:MAG: cytochrome c [Gemmatimonadota bacterium]|jgi:nitric oxide reductase subunit C